jgi:hypothetical protein
MVRVKGCSRRQDDMGRMAVRCLRMAQRQQQQQRRVHARAQIVSEWRRRAALPTSQRLCCCASSLASSKVPWKSMPRGGSYIAARLCSPSPPPPASALRDKAAGHVQPAGAATPPGPAS